ncbi:MAG: SUMF1/EgtB/PvdO family nonheme iron enzyme, partial [Planctomycetota bacterium]
IESKMQVLAPPKPPSSSEPSWFLKLPERERPRAKGVKPTATPGEWRNEKDGSILVRVPGGDCKLGLPGKLRAASVATFFIAKFEVTNAQFEKFVAETKHVTSCEEHGGGLVHKLMTAESDDEVFSGYDTRPGATWRDPELKGRPKPDEPVIQVSWDDAVAYCKWAGLVLPTEDEWEMAASWDPKERRARRFPWGDDRPVPGAPAFANLSDRAFNKLNGRKTDAVYDDGVAERSIVGTFRLDCSPCGAFDMGGNASEWCRGGVTGKQLDVTLRPYRGGNWCSTKDFAVCGFVIDPIPAYSGASWIGIRVALER